MMELTFGVISAIIAVLIVLLLRHLTRNYGYWKERGIPVPGGIVPGLGHWWPVFSTRKNVANVLEDHYNNFRDKSMVGLYVMTTPVLMIREPDLLKTVLQTNFNSFRHHQALDGTVDPLVDQNPFFLNDDKWRDARNVILSTMTSKKLKSITLIALDNCSKFVKYLNNKRQGKEFIEFEAKDTFKRVTVAITANSVLSVEEAISDEDSDNVFRKMMEHCFSTSTLNSIKIAIFFFLPGLNRILKTGFVPSWVNKQFAKIVGNLIEEREKGNVKREDLLQYLWQYCKEKNMPQTTIISHTFSFFMESYETSSLTLSFLTYHLAEYGEVQDKLRKHVNSVIEKYGGVISYEAINEMTYLDQVVSESIRFHAIATMLRKICTEEFELVGSDGLTCKMEPGKEIIVATYGLHHDPLYWKKPEEFRPERFDKDSEEFKERNNMVYLPFGEGPRQCPGKRLGTLIVKLIIVTIVRNFEIEKSPKLQEPVTLDPKNFLPFIKGGAWIKLKPLS